MPDLNDPGELALMLVSDMFKMVQARLDSSDWWIFPMCSPQSNAMARLIEGTYYMPDHSELFEILLFPHAAGFPILPVCMAHKSRMPASELVNIMPRTVAANPVLPANLRYLYARDVPVQVVEWFTKNFVTEPGKPGGYAAPPGMN